MQVKTIESYRVPKQREMVSSWLGMESEHRACQQFDFFIFHHLACFGNTKRIEAFRMAPQDRTSAEAFATRRPKKHPEIA